MPFRGWNYLDMALSTTKAVLRDRFFILAETSLGGMQRWVMGRIGLGGGFAMRRSRGGGLGIANNAGSGRSFVLWRGRRGWDCASASLMGIRRSMALGLKMAGGWCGC